MSIIGDHLINYGVSKCDKQHNHPSICPTNSYRVSTLGSGIIVKAGDLAVNSTVINSSPKGVHYSGGSDNKTSMQIISARKSHYREGK